MSTSSGLFQAITELNRTVHEPVRLAILSVLYSYRDADFSYLQGLLGLTNGNLNSHLSRLELANLIVVHKGYKGKKPHTTYWLSPHGERVFSKYVHTLSSLCNRLNP